MSKVSENVLELAAPLAATLGLEVVEVKYEKKHNGMNLTVFIDKAEGRVTINDCEALHRALDEPLDALNPTADAPYTLNVSSPGLDRPLTLDRDFARNMGKKIEVRLYAPLKGGKKSVCGVLTAFDDKSFTVCSAKGETHTFERGKTANVTPLIEF